MFDYYDTWGLTSLAFPPIPKTNLITGEGAWAYPSFRQREAQEEPQAAQAK